jgi:DNA-binding transcriptional ArsR family regulator
MTEVRRRELLAFFKALANESRLKIVGILANRECSVSDLADLLDLSEPTVSHHLSKLKDLDLVTMQADGNSHIYALNEEALIQLNKNVFSPEQMATLVDAVDEQSWQDKVRDTFVINGRLGQIPARQKKRLVILQWLAAKFEPNRAYDESEVNEMIKPIHPDTATLRRDLVSWCFLRRDHGVYHRMLRDEQLDSLGEYAAAVKVLDE